MKISMRFALDRNNNRKIEKEEVLSDLEELKGYDRDGSGSLTRRELDTVHFEYGKDTWLSGGRTHHLERDGFHQSVRLDEVFLDPFRINMKINMRPS